jgi:hypothetical protein
MDEIIDDIDKAIEENRFYTEGCSEGESEAEDIRARRRSRSHFSEERVNYALRERRRMWR